MIISTVITNIKTAICIFIKIIKRMELNYKLIIGQVVIFSVTQIN